MSPTNPPGSRPLTNRVVVVDDHQLVRDGLRALLGDQAGIEVVGEAGGVAEAVRRVAFAEPDVVAQPLSRMGVRNRSAAGAYLVRHRTAQERGFPPGEWDPNA